MSPQLSETIEFPSVTGEDVAWYVRSHFYLEAMILKTFHTIYERVEQVSGGSVVLLAMELQLLAMELVKTMQFDPSQSLRVTFKVLGGKTWLDTELGLTPESPWYGNSF